MEPFRLLAYDEVRRACMENCAYAALLFISCIGQMSHSKLTLFLSSYTLEKEGLESQFAERIIESLLRSGHLYEVRGGFYSALPSYAIQRDSEEWIILGDARVDHILRKEAPVFEVTSHATINEVTVLRLLLSTPRDAERLLHVAGIRAFQLAELVELVPDAQSLTIPKAWPGYRPGYYLGWQMLNERGCWESMESEANIMQGLCRALITNSEGRVISVRYLFRHEDGWSPITSEEASLWVFRLAAAAGEPYLAHYHQSKKVLVLPVGLPYTAYFVLKYLGRRRVVKGDQCIVEGVDYDIAQTVCRKLSIRLGTEVGS